MNEMGSTGTTATLLIISSIIFGAAIISATSSEITEETSDEGNLLNYAQQITDETSDEITTYLQTPYKLGKYYGPAHNQKIEKIIIMIKSMISKEINISDLTVKLFDGYNICLLSYSGNAELVEHYDVFEHPIWDKTTENDFSIIVTLDKDNSLVDHDKITEKTDMAYIIIKLPENMQMSKGDTMSITLIPTIGIQRTINIEAPLPMRPIVDFDN